MILEDIVQGSPEWLELRRRKITSSDIACLLGEAVYEPKTLYGWWQRKKGIVSNTVTESMTAGHKIEDVERAELEGLYNTLIRTVVVVEDWMMTSLDGISQDHKTIFEIKLANREHFEMACNDIPPRHMYIQCQWHLACTQQARECILSLFHMGERIQLRIQRDDDFISKAIAVGHDCHKRYIEGDEIPEISDGDYYVDTSDCFKLLVKNYELAKAELELAESNLEVQKRLLLDHAQEKNLKGHGCSVMRRYRQGVDYKKACEDSHVDLNCYRKKPVMYWTITTKKENTTMEDV